MFGECQNIKCRQDSANRLPIYNNLPLYLGDHGARRLPVAQANVPSTWLNDAVKGFLSPRGEFAPFLERPHLHVYVAEPHYLLAMKCAAMRLGEEFHDLDDVRYLLRHLNISTVDEALAFVGRYFDHSQLHRKTRLALEELLGK